MSNVSSPVKVVDPRLILGTEQSIGTPEFWLRLDLLADESDIYIGSGTLDEFERLLPELQKAFPLSPGDFWKLVGKWVHRRLAVQEARSVVCERHIDSSYELSNGYLHGSLVLINDIRSLGDESPIALASDQSMWSGSEESCSECQRSRVFVIDYRDLTEQGDGALTDIWRSEFCCTRSYSFEDLQEHSDRLFPDVVFSDVAWNSVGSLVGDSRDNTLILFEHLVVLNDLAVDIWTTYSSNDKRQSMLSANGVNGSPESPNVHRDAKAMKRRGFDFDGEMLTCEWHTKLRPNVNRVYFCVDGSAVFVGFIGRHL